MEPLRNPESTSKLKLIPTERVRSSVATNNTDIRTRAHGIILHSASYSIHLAQRNQWDLAITCLSNMW
jgi:hypothetical protein